MRYHGCLCRQLARARLFDNADARFIKRCLSVSYILDIYYLSNVSYDVFALYLLSDLMDFNRLYSCDVLSVDKEKRLWKADERIEKAYDLIINHKLFFINDFDKAVILASSAQCRQAA